MEESRAVNGILNKTQTLALVQQLGHTCNPQLGQNFLVDANIVRKSIQLANLQPGEHVVEIGPGLGTLTAALLQSGAHVYAVERDRKLFTYLSQNFAASDQHLNIIYGDALEHPIADLPIHTPFKIVANLPYAISTPWIERMLWGPLPTRCVLMLQRETAQRMTAQPGCKNYGPIAILLATQFEVLDIHKVPSQCFYPAPDVESALLVLQKRQQPTPLNKITYALIRHIFQYRRKQMGAIAKLIGEEDRIQAWLSLCELSHTVRPEAVAFKNWLKLV